MSLSIPEASPQGSELYRRLDEIVQYVWDPIGISGSPGARDEYYAYLPGLYGQLQKEDRDGMLEYMRRIVEEQMGMTFDEKTARKAVELLCEWKQYIDSEI